MISERGAELEDRRRALIRSQRADAQDLIFVQRFQSGFGHCCDSDRVAEGIKNLDRVAILPVGRRMMIDNFHHIAPAEAVLGNIAGKSGVSVKFESHGVLLLREQGNELHGSRQLLFHRAERQLSIVRARDR